jgi:hypothetical protein
MRPQPEDVASALLAQLAGREPGNQRDTGALAVDHDQVERPHPLGRVSAGEPLAEHSRAVVVQQGPDRAAQQLGQRPAGEARQLAVADRDDAGLV